MAKAFRCHGNTVRNVRQRFVEQGLAAALVRKKQVAPSRQRLLDGATAAHVIALRCSQPPAGQAQWTLQLLAAKLVKREVVETISDETVRQTLKNTLTPHLHKCWVIPPAHSADFVANRADVLALYQQPYAPASPVVHMDEQPLQLVTKPVSHCQPRPASHCAMITHMRVGTANVCLFTAPLTGWRTVDVCEQRTGVDWAHQGKPLLDDHSPADKVRLVCDNLNTHKVASLYEAFEPAEARRLARRPSYTTRPSTGAGCIVPRSHCACSASNVWTGAWPTWRRYDTRPRRGSAGAIPNRLALTGNLPPRMPVFGSNASTHNIKAERVLDFSAKPSILLVLSCPEA